MTNYSTLQRNILASLETDDAQTAFLWACDIDSSRYKYPAEAYAREVDTLVTTLSPMIEAANRPHGADEEAVLDFILKRHKNLRFPKGAAA